ncbi:hypothetical protein [Priestia megaterium]|uniref:hypothetical protein n=1 Tax=Priestia megaterium TaxID=1404 RepID=UPI002452EAAF|nr:hypothetical protein [Priestia megaterium]MDH3183547.1 hypothetical protein [Priestia megaterium]MDH3183587.1 hypothetical protein [Priestia megaterium]
MFKINKLIIEINTDNGLFGNKINFDSHLNIIHGNNITGKSTCVNVLLYALGLEELLGGKKEKTMKPVLRDEVDYDYKKFKVTESNVYLEIENNVKESITIKRSIKSKTRDANLVSVILGPKLTNPAINYKSQDMYIHSGGASTNALGFHTYLEQFLNWKLPYVTSFKGGEKKLYLQTIFPAFFIEQVRGWSDFLATVPTYYGIKNVTNRVIEFLLNLDVINTQKKQVEVIDKKQNIMAQWKNTYNNLEKLSQKISSNIEGISNKPEIIHEDSLNMFLVIKKDNKEIFFQDYLDKLRQQLLSLETIEEDTTISNRIEESKKELDILMEQLNNYELYYRELSNTFRMEHANYTERKEQLQDIEEDLVKNKDFAKLLKLGSDLNLSLSKDACPTCHQSIKESLLPQSIQQEPMSINENINFLEGQRSMLKVAIGASDKTITQCKAELEMLKNKMNETRLSIRTIKRELISDDRLPSYAHIEKIIYLKNEVKHLEEVEKDFNEYMMLFLNLSQEWDGILEEEASLPDQYFSETDLKKLEDLQRCFRKYVTEFGYESKETDKIEISQDRYFPTVNGFDMKFDSSASDHIRAIWAYTIALYAVSTKYECNHPGFILFDEPGQHQINTSHIKEFVKALYQLNGNNQFIVATSLQKEEFLEISKGIEFNYIHFDYKSIKPMDSIF